MLLTEDSCCVHRKGHLLWGELAFWGCLSWLFSLVILPPCLLCRQLNDVNFRMEFGTLGGLTSFPGLVLLERAT